MNESSRDSLGIYFTYAPKLGLIDESRNCISNVRLEGLSYSAAAHCLNALIKEAAKRQLSGVNLKDATTTPILINKEANQS